MKVRCIDAGGYSRLTAGRVYLVEHGTVEFYHFSDDKGHQSGVVQPKNFFEGKTILRVNNRNTNVMKFYFTDGTGVELWVECGSGSFAVPFHEVKKFTYTLQKCGRIGKVHYLP